MPLNLLPLPWRDRFKKTAADRANCSRNRIIQAPLGIDFCSNDYLGLRRDPRMAEAATQAAKAWGCGSGGGRLLRGTSPLHDELEQELAAWKGMESCLLFNTGFQCNSTLIAALLEPGDAVFSDSLNHASLVDGCRFAKSNRAHVGVYRHLDLDDLEIQLRHWREQSSKRGLA
ncbi:MAG: aminotransferase class I/II-fold pyridoxal phosphate-dependent enzyme, partial [Holophaga sp.]|nr:aminotransferase class I/II-fold pyridoxal phosphate-dependent enzyme [Holophaga sp.]